MGSIPFQTVRERLEGWLEAERTQLPLWLPVALGAGIAGWFVLPDPAAWRAAAALAGGVAVAALALGRGGRAARAVALFAGLVAVGLGLIWWRAERVAAPVLARPLVATLDARVVSLDLLAAEGKVRLLLAPEACRTLPYRRGAPATIPVPCAVPPRIRLSIDAADAPAGLAPASRIRVRARLVPPPPAAVPGAYDFARRAWFMGLGATGRALDPPVLIAPARPGWRETLAGWRTRLSSHIQSRLDGTAGGIAAALATGDTGAIPEADAEAMRRSGLAHLLSVSGLHLTAVVGATMLVTFRLLALWPALALRAPLTLVAAGVAATVGVAYTLLTGAEVPTVRSCIAALLVLLGLALGREAMTLRLVAVGALAVLLVLPESLVGPSFQLSFAAITAIVAFHEAPAVRRLLERREEAVAVRLLRGLAGLLATGLLVEAALAPIALYHFHRAGLYGAFANIVGIPLTTFVIMPLEAGALLLDMVGLGAPLWWLAGHALALLLWIARTVAAAPGAVAMLPSMPAAAFGLIVAGGLWLALWRTRVRLAGILPIAAGTALALAAPAPDLLVTGDGRHVAVRGADGRIVLLRPRAGDYIRRTLGELSGTDEEAGDLDLLAGARCNADLCAVEIARGGRRWRLLAVRSRYPVAIGPLVAACARTDIVVADRRLPRTCLPRWLKADGPLLRGTGGLAIDLGAGRVRTVAEGVGAHPWATAAEVPGHQ